MNSKHFFRIIKQNIIVIILFPAIVVAMVLYFSKSDGKEFTSTASIIAKAAESTIIDKKNFGIFNAKSSSYIYDNLINIPKYKETAEAVSIRLLAKHLMLEQPDTRVISDNNYNKLMESVPDDVKQLVVRESDTEKIQEINDKARDSNKVESKPGKVVKTKTHTATKDETLFLIAEIYNTSVKELKKLNPELKNSNLILLGQKIVIKKSEPELKNNNENKSSGFEEVTAFDITVKNLTNYLHKDRGNYLFKLLNSHDPHYSIQAVSKINGSKKNKSNVIEYTFVSDDPLFARQTLLVLIEYLVEDYNKITESESDITFRFYEGQAEEARERLLAAEDSLMLYKQQFRIINYYEQSRHLSMERERIAKDLSYESANLYSEKLAINDIEQKMAEKDKIILSIKNVDALRIKMIDVSSKITGMEVMGIDSVGSDGYKQYQQLLAEKSALAKQLEASVDSYSDSKYSLEGASIGIVIKEWLKHKIAYDVALAKTRELKRRLSEYEKRIYNYSSIGANINRNEREIKVLEQEYLGYLKNINKSKLSNTIEIRIVDYPSYPRESVISRVAKKGIFSGLLGLILIVLLLVLIDLVDRRIKTVERAELFTGLSVKSVFPKLIEKTNGVDYRKVINRVSGLVVQFISVHIYSNPDKKQYNVLVTSTKEKEGKTFITLNVVSKLRESGNKVLYINGFDSAEIDENQLSEFTGEDNLMMDIKEINMKSNSWEELLSETGKNPKDYNNIFIEIPDLMYHQYPFNILSKMDLTVLVCSANRTWENADKLTLNRFRESWKSEMIVVLNRVDKHVLKSVLGYLPLKKK